MWIRNQARDRLIEVNELSIIEGFDEIGFFNDCKKKFEIAANPVNRRIKYAFETQEIVEVKEIDWYEFYEVEKEKHKNSYLAWRIKSVDTILAIYPTKERCLEVLDEIQYAISNFDVYQMPEED